MNFNLNKLNKKDIQKKIIKETQSKKIFEDQNYLIFMRGDIFIKEYTLIKKIISFYKTNKIREISNAFNGNYVIFFMIKTNIVFSHLILKHLITICFIIYQTKGT